MTSFRYFPLIAVGLLAFVALACAQTLHLAAIEVAGSPPRFIANSPQGGLTKVGADRLGIYNIVALSGTSQPADGDQIRIYDSSNKTLWLEKDGKVSRHAAQGQGKSDPATVFTIKSDGSQFRLIAASGLFVATGDRKTLGTTPTESEALLFNFQWDAAKPGSAPDPAQ